VLVLVAVRQDGAAGQGWHACAAGRVKLPDGKAKRTGPAFQLMAERYLDDYTRRWRSACGIPADTIVRLAAEIAHAAFEQAFDPRPSVDRRHGTKHDKMIGRPVSMHAMRGISAHSNGFQTCRAIHMLQILLGSIDCPAASATSRPSPSSTRRPPAGRQGRKRSAREAAWRAAPWASRTGRRPAGRGRRDARGASTRRFRGTRPFGARLMHMVISNAACNKRPVRHRRAVHLHGEHGLEFLDEFRRHHGAC
jgi:anaerobic selenocysteine-containing dehydrogenase